MCVASVLYAPRRLNPRGGPCLSYSSSPPLPRAISRRARRARGRRHRRRRKESAAFLSFYRHRRCRPSSCITVHTVSLFFSLALSFVPLPSSLRPSFHRYCLSRTTSKPPNSLAIRSWVYSRHCETKAAPYLFRDLPVFNQLPFRPRPRHCSSHGSSSESTLGAT